MLKWMTTRVRNLGLIGVALSLLVSALLLSHASPYHPGLAPAAGYQVRNLTAPADFAAGYLKELQALLDVTPCTYEILGWGSDRAFYYRSVCHGQLQVWQADPLQPNDTRLAHSLPSNLFNEHLSKRTVLDRVHVPSARPVTIEPWVREVNLQNEGYPSPDGRWLALVAERVYGPQDVLLITDQP
jgi:hypothetical protein